MIRTLRGIGVAAAVAGTLVVLPGTASAAESGYVSGYEGAGMVSGRTTHPGDNCLSRRALYVVHTDNPEIPEAKRGDSAPGAGLVCVTQAAFDRYTIGQWWSGRARGPRG